MLRFLVVLVMLMLLWGCSTVQPVSSVNDTDLKLLGNSIPHSTKTDNPIVVEITSISLGHVVSSSATSTAYRVNVPTAVPFLVAALQSNPISTTTLPRMMISCPTSSGGTNLLSSLQSNAMLTCTPQFSSGDSGDVQVGMEHTTSALLFALRTDQGTTATFSSLNLMGVPLGANTAQLYRIENTSTNVKQRSLVFSAGVSDSVAMLYRVDGMLICSSLSSDVCQVYDRYSSNYYLVVVNASATDTTYDIRFDG